MRSTMVSNEKKNQKAVIRSLAALTVNLSAGWFGVVIIAPNFWPIAGIKEVAMLTGDIYLGTLFWLLSYRLERKLL